MATSHKKKHSSPQYQKDIRIIIGIILFVFFAATAFIVWRAGHEAF
jgi:hypothetical protein